MSARNLLYEVSLFVNMYFCLPIFRTFFKSSEIGFIKGTVLTTHDYMKMSVQF